MGFSIIFGGLKEYENRIYRTRTDRIRNRE